MTNVAVIGAGLIGRAWCIVFARAGFQVALWDQFPLQVTQALAFISDRLPELRAAGLLADEPATVLARIQPYAVHVGNRARGRTHPGMRAGARGHEADPCSRNWSAPLEPTQSLHPRPRAFRLVHSPRSENAAALPDRPPRQPAVSGAAGGNLPRAVDRSGGRGTDPRIMVQAGQVPATVKKEIDGFALNRLQGALLAEAFRLLADDVISPADLDALVKHGLGLRWSFMGPLETIDLNAPGGLADYCDRYGPLYATMQEQMKPLRGTRRWWISLHAARRADLPTNMQAVRQEWRDRRLMALLAHKATQVD